MAVRNTDKNTGKINVWLGTFELALFMKSSVTRFPDGIRDAARAMVVSFTVLLVTVFPLYVVPSDRLGARSYFEIAGIHVTMALLSTIVFFSALWLVAKPLNKTDRFWRTFTICNYSSLVQFVFIAPLLLMVMAGYHSWEEIYPLMIVIMFYQIAMIGFALTFAMGLPWQFAAGLSILGLFVDQTAQNTVFFLLGIQPGSAL